MTTLRKSGDTPADAARANQPLPEAYRRLFRIWFALGWPAFGALLVVLYVMVFKPLWRDGVLATQTG